MDNLEIKIAATDEGTLIAFSGVVDEQASFGGLDVRVGEIIFFDLAGVTLINSLGIRNWIAWMKTLKSRTFVFRRCSRPIVDQINVIAGFLPPGAVVESFYVPYHCESCDSGERVLFSLGTEYTHGTADAPETLRPPSNIMCSKCQEAMEMDVTESKYFSFLKYRR